MSCIHYENELGYCKGCEEMWTRIQSLEDDVAELQKLIPNNIEMSGLEIILHIQNITGKTMI